MMWNFVEVEILIWQALEKVKNFLSASGFNLYYRYILICQVIHCLNKLT
jgi:hypothetical protein